MQQESFLIALAQIAVSLAGFSGLVIAIRGAPYTRHVPKERWEEALEETRQMYPTLFPKRFHFGHGDPIFANAS
jgi:hypothetical protein